MTLSQFLRDYLYIPLGGNRRGRALRYVNLMITMLLGGLWHGAAWTFVVWGALHGALSLHQPRLEQFRPEGRAALCAGWPMSPALDPDISCRGRRLGVLPRRQHVDGAIRAVEDGRSHPHRASAAPKSLYALFIAIYAAIAWFAPNTQTIMGYDHEQRIVGERLRRWRMRPLFPLRHRRGAGVRDSRHPAAQRIHLFQVLMDICHAKNLHAVSRRERGDHAVAVGAEFRRRSVATVPAGAAVSPRCIRTDSRMQDAGLIRSQEFDTVFMGTSLAIHFRQSDIDRRARRPLAEAGDDRARTRASRALCWRRRMERHPKRVIWQMDDWIFRDAPEIDADIYLPADLYRRNARGLAEYLFSGAMARESLWIAGALDPAAGAGRRAADAGVLFKFPIADVDDINMLRPGFDVPRFYNAKKAHRRVQAHHRSRAQRLSRRGL